MKYSLALFLMVISAAHADNVGFLCKGRNLYASGLGLAGSYDTDKDCADALKLAHGGFICRKRELRGTGDTAWAGVASEALCRDLVRSAKNGFVCNGANLMGTAKGLIGKAYSSQAACQADVQATTGSFICQGSDMYSSGGVYVPFKSKEDCQAAAAHSLSVASDCSTASPSAGSGGNGSPDGAR